MYLAYRCNQGTVAVLNLKNSPGCLQKPANESDLN